MQINLKDSTIQTFVEQAAPNSKLVTTKSYDEAVELLFNDKINALVADYPFWCLHSLSLPIKRADRRTGAPHF